MRKCAALPLSAMVAALVLASVVSLVAPQQQAQAAFPDQEGKIAFVSNRDGDDDIYTIDPTGDNLKRLTPNPGDDNHPAWSSDGKKIAFSSRERGAYHDEYDIYVMKADGSAKSLVTRERSISGPPQFDTEPAFSPSGQRIVFTRATPHQCGDENLYRIRTDGKNLTRLTHYSGGCYFSHFVHGPAWSPDGTKIAYGVRYSDYGYARQIRVVKPDGRDLGWIEGQYDDSWYPDWSPDGSAMVFAKCCFSLGKMTLTGLHADPPQSVYPAEWSPQGAFDLTGPAFSPEGSRMVFSSNRDGDYELYIMDANGTNVRQLTNNHARDTLPDWQPVVP